MRSRVRSPAAVYVALALIVLASLAGNLYWVQRNVVLIGHDASGYLGTSLEYLDFLPPVTPQTLFRALTYDDYRPTALFVAVQPFFALFGPSTDSAQVLNLLLSVAVILLTFAFGRSVAGPGIGLFAALLVAFMPMVAAMARLFYTELFLTATVVLNLLALVKSDGLRSRPWSLIWGVSLGVGLLVKWTMPIYVGLSVLWYLWRQRFFQELWLAIRQFRLRPARLLAAALLALAVSLAWFWPNRTLAQEFALGNVLPQGTALLLGWWLLLTPLCYALLAPSSPPANGWAGLLLGAAIASLWYLPHSDIGARLLQVDEARGKAPTGIFASRNYWTYLFSLYSHQLGRLAFWLIVPAALWPWLRSLWRRQSLIPLAPYLWLSLLSTYVALVLVAQSGDRNLVPLSPVIAILCTVALWQISLPWRGLLGGAWVAVLVVQWSIFTFDSLTPLFDRTAFLWNQVDYSRPPASNDTDRGYWIGPDVLARVAAAADAGGEQELVVLANTTQLHRGVLNVLLELAPRPIDIVDMTEADSPGWADLLPAQWVLVKDGDNANVEEPGRAIAQRIVDGDGLFSALFRLAMTYPLPDGDRVDLYRRVLGPGHPRDLPLQIEQTRPVADAIRAAWSEHARLIYADPDRAVWVGIHDPAAERITVLGADDRSVDEQLAPLTGTLLVVLSHDADDVQAWLDAHAYRTVEVGDDFAAVAIYGRPDQPLETMAVDVAWTDAHLTGLASLATVAPGEVLPVETRLTQGPDGDAKWSVRIVDGDGQVIASHDRPLVAVDRFGLFVPPATTPGTYDVVAIRYDPATGVPIPTASGAHQVHLMGIEVLGENQ